MSNVLVKNSHKVTAKLIKGDEAEAVIDVLGESYPSLVVKDYVSYYAVENESELRFELPKIGEALGRRYDVPDLLTILASYSGQADVQDGVLTIKEMRL